MHFFASIFFSRSEKNTMTPFEYLWQESSPEGQSYPLNLSLVDLMSIVIWCGWHRFELMLYFRRDEMMMHVIKPWPRYHWFRMWKVVCSFAGYQRSCDRSDILVLDDEHYTTRYPLSDIKSIFWVTFSEPAYHRFWIRRCLENNVNHPLITQLGCAYISYSDLI